MPAAGQVAILARDLQPVRNRAERSDEPQSQHDGHGPEFTQSEVLHGLVGRNERAQRLGVDLSVDVGNQFPREVMDALGSETDSSAE